MNGPISFSISGCLPTAAAVIEGILRCTQPPVKGCWQELGFYAELRCGLSFLLSLGLESLLDQHKALFFAVIDENSSEEAAVSLVESVHALWLDNPHRKTGRGSSEAKAQRTALCY